MASVMPIFFLLMTLTLTLATQGTVTTTTTAPPGDHHDDEISRLVQALNTMPERLNNVGLGSTVMGYILQRLAYLERGLQTKQDDMKDFIQTTVANQLAAGNHWAGNGQSGGSTFVRWGRKRCPNETALVYTGYAGGKHYNQKGGGTNTICLPTNPQFDNTPVPSYYAAIYGTEYDWMGIHHNQDAPCTVCLTPQAVTIMIPSTLTCPDGWLAQYTGYLVAHARDLYASEYQCLDGIPEYSTGGVRDNNDHLFQHVLIGCGSLPCPPYVQDKVALCVVCSK